MMTYLIGYISTLLTFVVIDVVWLATMTPRFYRPTLGDILISGVNLPPALIFYLLYPIGLLVFAMNPALKSESIKTAILYGAFSASLRMRLTIFQITQHFETGPCSLL